MRVVDLINKKKQKQELTKEEIHYLIKGYFTRAVDAACVYVNVPTAFTDGGEFGLGAEIGISTQKLHARGPMGLEELNTYKWIIRGEGQTRNN